MTGERADVRRKAEERISKSSCVLLARKERERPKEKSREREKEEGEGRKEREERGREESKRREKGELAAAGRVRRRTF